MIFTFHENEDILCIYNKGVNKMDKGYLIPLLPTLEMIAEDYQEKIADNIETPILLVSIIVSFLIGKTIGNKISHR